MYGISGRNKTNYAWYFFKVHIYMEANNQIEIFTQLYWSNYFIKYDDL